MYTHKIKFEILSKVTKIWCAASFPTTEDALEISVSGLKNKRNIRNVVIERIKK